METKVDSKYWRSDLNAPFAQLLDTIEAYCHPEADEAYDELAARAHDPDDAAMEKFKGQLIEALQDPGVLRANALFEAARYSEGSDLAFLRRLWGDLYGGEPVPEGPRPAKGSAAAAARVDNPPMQRLPRHNGSSTSPPVTASPPTRPRGAR